MTRDELIGYVAERFSTDPEYPWADEAFIFRHRENRKWFAVAMRVPYRRLGLPGEGAVDIADALMIMRYAMGLIDSFSIDR